MLNKFLAALFIAAAGSAFACCNTDLQDADAAVKVIDSTVTTSKADGPLIVTVLGSLQNTTEYAVGELVVEAKLMDSSGKVVDVVTQPVYGVVVAAGSQVAFRMQAPAAAKEASYSSVHARVSSGESQVPRAPRVESKSDNPLVAFLLSWGPILLLILVWLYMVRRHSGKGSAQHRSLDLIAEQNAMLSRQLVAIESIASAARGTQPRSDA